MIHYFFFYRKCFKNTDNVYYKPMFVFVILVFRGIYFILTILCDFEFNNFRNLVLCLLLDI